MTGPEHYAQAEALLESAARERIGSDQERYLLAAAQVRATLALAAATALTSHLATYGDEPEINAWKVVAAVADE
ncbi:hypothetical protein [Microbispora rosea]